MPRGKDITSLSDGSLQSLIRTGSAEQRQAAKREWQQRERNRRAFVRGLDDDELEEIVGAGPHDKLGPYVAQMIEAGVEPIDSDRLQELAHDERQRRLEVKAVEDSEPVRQPFRVVEW